MLFKCVSLLQYTLYMKIKPSISNKCEVCRDVIGFAEGENRLRAARPFCSSVNVFLHYQEAPLFPEA